MTGVDPGPRHRAAAAAPAAPSPSVDVRERARALEDAWETFVSENEISAQAPAFKAVNDAVYAIAAALSRAEGDR